MDVEARSLSRSDKRRLLTIFHRLFEAHFLPIHLLLVLTASSYYTSVYPAFLIPTILRLALRCAAVCRLISFCTMLAALYAYEEYHHICVGLRKEEMRKAGLLEKMEENDSVCPNVFSWAGILEAALFPLGGILFGAIPALHAVFSHIFTQNLQYVVSAKP
jgi:hypothetical protein